MFIQRNYLPPKIDIPYHLDIDTLDIELTHPFRSNCGIDGKLGDSSIIKYMKIASD
ncbi:MAG: hypothetical protein QNJ34_09015 [Xenococcaceae cyanobacterium MO_188.B29]|nr:hypothetical protein [Xenococcaceae cyanobacterium MO_188.B29]